MTILGIDTSMAVTSACLLLDDGSDVSTPAPDPQRLFEPPQHSAELLPIIHELLERSGTGWGELESIAVGVGPGTFTGLRIGVSTARALGQALEVKLRPVSSLEALGAGIAEAAGPQRTSLPLIDARRKQVFASAYLSGELQWGPLAVSQEELAERLGRTAPPALAAGDWALKSQTALEAVGVEVAEPGSGLHHVGARYLCLIGLERAPVLPQEVEPTYVRLPDAEINRRAADDQGAA